MNSPVPRPALDATVLRSWVGGDERPWRRLDIVTETGSTNTDLLARAAAGDDIRGAVLAAEFQNSGRGRHGRVWSAPARSQITLSVGVDACGVPADAWGWLPLVTGLAVVDMVCAVSAVSPGLKWPNDVLVGGHKLAGILAEVSQQPGPVIVVGVGVNATLTEGELPDPAATSLALLGVTELDRTALIGEFLDRLGHRVSRWRAIGGADDETVADYRRASVTLGARVRAVLPGENQVEGTARDIDALGRLVIDNEAGSTAVSAGDITHLRPG